jgi:lysyl-tRNA synthetase class 2
LLFDLPPAAGLAPQEKEEILRRYQLTQLQRHYISKFREDDGDVFPAASFPQALTRQQLVDFAAYTWGDDGLYLFREMMLRACREREGLTGQPQFTCPVKFDTHVIALHDAEGKSWKDCRDSFGAHGLPIDGWVHPEDFEEKLAIVRDLVSSAIDAADDKDAAREHIRSSETVGVWTQRITVEPW